MGSVMGLVFLLNLPFGWWRDGTRRFSLPFLLASYFLGQLTGSRLRHRRPPRVWTNVTARE